MAITRIKNSTISNKTPKYNDVLAGLPFRPIIGTATDGGNGTSVSVAFTGNNVANGTITYTALSSPGSLTGTGTSSPITVSGLTSGTAYTFQVKAGNSLGDSAYSAASNSVTPVTPTAFDSIASTTLTSTTSTITFNSIPGTYQHLQLRFICRSSSAGNYGTINMNFNSVTSASYAYHNISGDGASVTAQGLSGETAMYIPQHASGGSAADIFGVGVIDIHDYASTTKNKTVRAFSGVDRNGSGSVWLISNLFNNTGAVTKIELTSSAGSFVSGSTFALYGIAGA